MTAKRKTKANGVSASDRQLADFISGRIFTRADETFFLPMRLRLGSGKLSDPYTQNAWVYAAIKAKSTPISGVPFVVSRNETALDDSDPWSKLFDRPNPMMSGSEFFAGLSTYLDLEGEALIAVTNDIGGGFSPGRPPTEMWLLAKPSSWDHVLSGGRIVRWERKSNAGKESFPASQIIHVKEFNPSNPYRGLAPVAAVMGTLQTDFRANAFNAAFYENGADPGGVLMTDMDLTKLQKEGILAAWQSRHGGTQNANRVAILEGGLRYEPITVSHEAMQFIPQKEWTREEILAVFGVPKLQVGLIGDVNRNTAEVTTRQFWADVLVPRLRLIQAGLNAFFFPRGSAVVRGEFDLSVVDALSEDVEGKIDQATKLGDLGYGLNAVNERIGLGMADVPWGDVPLESSRLVPVTELHKDPGGFITGPAGSRSVRALADRREWLESHLKRFTFPSEDAIFKALRKFYKKRATFTLKEFKRWADTLKGVRAPELPKLSAKVVNGWLGSVASWASVGDESKGAIAKALKAALSGLENDLGGFTTVTPDLTQAWVRAAGIDRVASLVVVAKKQRVNLRKLILKQTASGGISNVRELQKTIVAQFKMMDQSRALRIARTETGMLSSAIRFEGMKREGVKKHEWITAGDLIVRPEDEPRPVGDGNHRDLDGDIVKIGTKFRNGLTHPHQSGGKANEVINCRCVAAPVFDEE